MFLCWPHSSPGNVSVPCPSYLPWISEGDNFIELFPFYTTTEKTQSDGCASREKHAFQCLAQSADDSRRAHRECLGTGKWQEKPNSSEPWRDDSECREDHYFKDKVMHHYWQNKVCGGVTTTFWLLPPKLDPQGMFFQRPCLWGGIYLFSLHFLVCAGRWNASASSPQAHLHYWLFPVTVLAHGGHPGDGSVEVSQE